MFKDIKQINFIVRPLKSKKKKKKLIKIKNKVLLSSLGSRWILNPHLD